MNDGLVDFAAKIETRMKTMKLESENTSRFVLMILTRLTPASLTVAGLAMASFTLANLTLVDRVLARAPEPVSQRVSLGSRSIEFGGERRVVLQVSQSLRSAGDLKITVRDTSVLTVSATLISDDADLAEDEIHELEESLRLSLLEEEEELELSIGFGEIAPPGVKMRNWRLAIELSVPPGSAVEISAPYLEIFSSGALAELLVRDSRSEVTVRGVRGHVSIRASNATLEISDLRGTFDVQTSNEPIVLTDVTITDSTSDAGRIAHARTANARIKFQQYRGPLSFQTTRAQIRGRDVSLSAGRSSLSNKGGEVDVIFSSVDVEAQLRVRNLYDAVRLVCPADISTVFSLRAPDGGTIELSGILHTIKRSRETMFEAIAANGSGVINVLTRNGGDIIITSER